MTLCTRLKYGLLSLLLSYISYGDETTHLPVVPGSLLFHVTVVDTSYQIPGAVPKASVSDYWETCGYWEAKEYMPWLTIQVWEGMLDMKLGSPSGGLVEFFPVVVRVGPIAYSPVTTPSMIGLLC